MYLNIFLSTYPIHFPEQELILHHNTHETEMKGYFTEYNGILSHNPNAKQFGSCLEFWLQLERPVIFDTEIVNQLTSHKGHRHCPNHHYCGHFKTWLASAITMWTVWTVWTIYINNFSHTFTKPHLLQKSRINLSQNQPK